MSIRCESSIDDQQMDGWWRISKDATHSSQRSGNGKATQLYTQYIIHACKGMINPVVSKQTPLQNPLKSNAND